jgi:hypothetical protein
VATVHVYPVDDLAEHDTESENCPCGIRVIEESHGRVIVHSSFDGRERHEPDYRPPEKEKD